MGSFYHVKVWHAVVLLFHQFVMLNVSSVSNFNNIYFFTIFGLCSIIIHLLEHSVLYLILAAAKEVRRNSC